MRHERFLPALAVLLGATAAVLQVTALRELVTLFAGSELDLGITLALWLAAVGAGSAAGGRLRSPAALGVTVLLSGLLAQPLLGLAPAVRPLLGLAPGEDLSPAGTIMTTAAVLAPFCLPLGAQFPLVVRALGGRAGQAYLLEAAGACAGGLVFTFLVAGRVGAPVVLAAAAAVHVLLAAALLRRPAVLGVLAVPLALFALLPNPRTAPAPGGREAVERRESRYGVVEVYRDRGQLNFFAGGRFQYAYPDRETDELRTHLPLLMHPRPRRVLFIGGSPALLREALKHGVDRAELVELDPVLLEAALARLLPEDRAPLGSGRAGVVIADARRHVASLPAAGLDLIVLNLPAPATASLNRCYTAEFFREAAAALRPGGVITVSLPSSFGYVGRRLQEANGAVFRALAASFPHAMTSTEEHGIVAASAQPLDPRPEVLRRRFAERKITTGSFHASLIDDAFAPLRSGEYRERLAAARGLNSDSRPAAYLAHVQVWLAQQGGGILLALTDHGRILLAAAVLVLAGAAVATRRTRRAAVGYAVLLAGYSSLSLSIVIMLAYQSAVGYVYERVGFLIAAFMAGTAAGGRLGREPGRPLQRMLLLEGSAVALFSAAPLFFRNEALFLLLNGLAGGLGGALFSAAAASLDGSGEGAAGGRLYGLDLAGSFLGALLTALITVPLMGLYPAVLLVVLCKLVSLSVLSSLRHA
jgi:spermidine synthase